MAYTMMESFFQRSLEDMVKGLRVQMIGEAAYISKALEEVRKEIKSTDLNTKAAAVQKLTYLNMLNGTDMSWAAFHVVEVMSMQQFCFKKIGYLAASQSFDEGTDVLLLITNLLRKDFGGKNEYESSLAIDGLSRLATPDLARDLMPELFNMLASGRAFVRKKATVALLRVFTQYPDAIRVAFKRLIERLSDRDPSVITAAVSVLCDLAVRDPKPYLPLAPELYKILVDCPNNWLCIKIVKILGLLAPLEPRLGKKIAEPLCGLLRTSEAKSLLLECIRTVTSGLTDHQGAINLCVEKLKELMGEDDTNLKFLCLRALANLMPVHPWAVAEIKEVIVKCLDHRDPSIQKGALRLIIGMVSQSNLTETVQVLLQYAYKTDRITCNELVSVILSTCSSDNYVLISDFAWYISILVDMARIPHCECGDEIGRQLIDIGIRVRSASGVVLSAGRDLLLDPALYNCVSVHGLLSVAAWIAGEYVAFSHNCYELVEALLQPRTRLLPASVRAIYVQAVFKVFVYSAAKSSGEHLSSINGGTREGNYSSDKASLSGEIYTAEVVLARSPMRSVRKGYTEDYPDQSTRRSESKLRIETFTEKSCWDDKLEIEQRGLEGAYDLPDNSGSLDRDGKVRILEADLHRQGTNWVEQQGLPDSLEHTINLTSENMTALVTSSDVEVQERACNLLGLLHFVKDIAPFTCRYKRDSPQSIDLRELLEALLEVFSGELSPVPVHAQGKVAPPEGLILENLNALGAMHSKKDAMEGLIGKEDSRDWGSGKLFASQNRDSSSKVDESAALLAQHRQRHQQFYLPSEGNAGSNSSGYPRPEVAHLSPLVQPVTSSIEAVPPSDTSLSWPKSYRSRARTIVLELDEEDDLESSLKVKKKDLKDELISSTIRNLLASAHSVHKDQVAGTAQGLEKWDSVRTHQDRSRGRPPRQSGRKSNRQTCSSVKHGSSLERRTSLGSEEVDREPSGQGKGPEHIKAGSRQRHSRNERRTPSSSQGGEEEPQASKSLQKSSRKSKGLVHR